MEMVGKMQDNLNRVSEFRRRVIRTWFEEDPTFAKVVEESTRDRLREQLRQMELDVRQAKRDVQQAKQQLR